MLVVSITDRAQAFRDDMERIERNTYRDRQNCDRLAQEAERMEKVIDELLSEKNRVRDELSSVREKFPELREAAKDTDVPSIEMHLVAKDEEKEAWEEIRRLRAEYDRINEEISTKERELKPIAIQYLKEYKRICDQYVMTLGNNKKMIDGWIHSLEIEN